MTNFTDKFMPPTRRNNCDGFAAETQVGSVQIRTDVEYDSNVWTVASFNVRDPEEVVKLHQDVVSRHFRRYCDDRRTDRGGESGEAGRGCGRMSGVPGGCRHE